MAPARHVIVAGAGIAGLTAALAMARAGLRVTVLEQAAKLEETGAGIQLSPNATRILIALGLRERLQPPSSRRRRSASWPARSGREIVRIPLGAEAEQRYGAPYLDDPSRRSADGARATPRAANPTSRSSSACASRISRCTPTASPCWAAAAATVDRRARHRADRRRRHVVERCARASADSAAPRFRHRTAWRALVPAEALPREFRAPAVHLWLGHDAHLVHYPVKGGTLINIVAIVHDDWNESGWSARRASRETCCAISRAGPGPSKRATCLRCRSAGSNGRCTTAPRRFRGGKGPVTLIGDAAHPMLPFLAQGAGMAIEDAAVLADMLGEYLDDPADALRAYEGARRRRIARVQQAARRQGRIYGLSGPEALLRNLGDAGDGRRKTARALRLAL